MWKCVACTQEHTQRAIFLTLEADIVGKGSSLWGTASSLCWASHTLSRPPHVPPHTPVDSCCVFRMELVGKSIGVGCWASETEPGIQFKDIWIWHSLHGIVASLHQPRIKSPAVWKQPRRKHSYLRGSACHGQLNLCWSALSLCLQWILPHGTPCDCPISPGPLSGTMWMCQQFSNMWSGGKHLASCQNPLRGFPKMGIPNSFPVTTVRFGVGFWN